jgi:hypothetical protein
VAEEARGQERRFAPDSASDRDKSMKQRKQRKQIIYSNKARPNGQYVSAVASWCLGIYRPMVVKPQPPLELKSLILFIR